MTNSAILSLVYLAIHIVFAIRIIIRPHRDPASRLAWLVVIIFAPVIGIIAYILLGEVNIGRSRVRRAREILDQLPRLHDAPGGADPAIQPTENDVYAHLYRATGSINGFSAHGGNTARLMSDSNAAIAQMVEDIDNATEHVHLLFYIWLTDNNGRKVADALKRAAARGVVCRAMADGLGSRDMIKSRVWKEMREAGVRMAVALPIGNPLLRALRGRVDLRNHRKILVIDNRVTFCGSQNCADPEFRVKPKYAPWVDAVMRFEGPVVRQNQFLFASDWMAQVPDDNIDDLLKQPMVGSEGGFTAMAFGTGPTNRYSAMPEVFENLLYTARREMVITTPYYVPTDSMQAALCASARRGVRTTIVFPARNDSWIVACASHSYYAELLEAGVRIREYVGGLLHTKSMTIDDEVTLIGSANMDRRSFELNYENNILLVDRATTAAMRGRQDAYLASSREVTPEMVAAWSLRRRLINNTVAMLGPVL
jgi:cardiolipin synthase